MQEYFSLFGLPEHFGIDVSQLEAAYRTVQAQVHPDRFANRPETERRVAMQWATLANEAFRTLKSPVARASYLLERRGIEQDVERNTSMSQAFLLQQMEWRTVATSEFVVPRSIPIASRCSWGSGASPGSEICRRAISFPIGPVLH